MVLDALLLRLGFTATYSSANKPFLHPGRSAELSIEGVSVGYIGALHPSLNKILDLPADVYAFELDLSALPLRSLPKASAISRFPSVRRDLALIVPESVAWSDIEQCVHKNLGQKLQSVLIFDQYRGAGLQPGTKSLAIGLILHDISRTLNDLEVEQSVSTLLAALNTECQVTLRT